MIPLTFPKVNPYSSQTESLGNPQGGTPRRRCHRNSPCGQNRRPTPWGVLGVGSTCVPWSRLLLYWGWETSHLLMGILIINGYINPYYWVDDHPLLYGNNGSLDTGTTPQKFNSSPLKNAAWKMILSFWVPVTFQGRTVKRRECNPTFNDGILIMGPYKPLRNWVEFSIPMLLLFH